MVVVATDEAGNESSQTVTVDVTDFDEINPAITGPSEKPVRNKHSFYRRKYNCGACLQQMRQSPGH